MFLQGTGVFDQREGFPPAFLAQQTKRFERLVLVNYLALKDEACNYTQPQFL